jgi:methionine synthase II (cobalamin-independent)
VLGHPAVAEVRPLDVDERLEVLDHLDSGEQRRHAGGEIGTREFKRIEDRAVDQVLELQEDAGVDVVTDGELRRTHFAGPILDACDGLEDKLAPSRPYYGPDGRPIVNETPRSVTGKLVPSRALVTEEYVYARGHTDKPIKVTLPSPTNIAHFWSPEHSRDAYPDPFDLFADAADVLRREIDELARLGCTDVQLDAPELATVVDEIQAQHYASVGIDPQRFVAEGIAMLNDLASHPAISFTLHLCKGSKYRGWAAAGGYHAIAERVFAGATSFDSFLLEYDDERSGTFDPLRAIPDDKVVALGLVSTRRPEIESIELIEARVAEAAKHFPREQLALSTQCGFASGLVGDAESMRFQHDKLARVAEAAHRLWS